MRGYLKSFGSIILHDGTSRFAKEVKIATRAATFTLVRTAAGGYFDPYGANDAPTQLNQIQSTHLLKFASPSSLNLEIATLEAAIGTRATLTAVQMDGSPDQTCQARLIQMQRGSPKNSSRNEQITLTFQPVTEWA
ncbi:MAG: hypothetical protein CUN56_00210 [Phototrophicales bacterium]|nr:MAG: hypothetical protein CUN56_00210 [Phototrophicales bacterium]